MTRALNRLPLEIYINSEKVGELRRSARTELEFLYADEWIAHRPDFPISRCFPVRGEVFRGAEVLAYFDNLLPDNKGIRRAIAARHRAPTDHVFDLLFSIGRDCVGALQFLPQGESPPLVEGARGETLSDKKIAAVLQDLRRHPLGTGFERDFRISIAGAQEKTALLRSKSKWYLPLGSTPTTHILKPSMGKFFHAMDMSESVENEWLTMGICRELGLPVAEVEIEDFENVRVLVVTRFDREHAGDRIYRVPQEDFCQALGVHSLHKYESDGGPGILKIMDLLSESKRADHDRRIFLKSQIVFWLLAAVDGHAKNFSVAWAPGGFFLTPLYDILSAEPMIAKRELDGRKIKLSMAVGDRRHYRISEIASRHWYQTAKKSRFLKEDLEEIFHELTESVKTLESKIKLPKRFPSSVAGPIFAGIQKRIKLL